MTTTGWVERELGDILTLNYGWSLPKTERVPGNFPVYGSNGIVGTHHKALVASPGLVVGRKGSAGNVHYSRKPFCPIDTTFFIASNDTSVDLEFLYFLLLHVDLRRILGDVGVPGLNREMAYRERALVPKDPKEQQKIASALSLVQRAIEQQEKLVALTTELKKSLMHKLFTEGLRGEPQKQTEIGPMPESWGVVALGSQYNTQLGKMLSQKARTGADPRSYLRNKNVQWGLIDTTDLLSMSYSEREREKFQLVSGDLLVCEGGEPGRAAIWYGEIEDCYYQKALFRVRPKSTSVSNEYLAFWLEYSIRYHDLYSTGGASSTIAHLPEVQLRLLPIPLPSREEQDSIVEFIAATDEKAATHRHKRAALSDLFRTLLPQLMTGQVRVGDLDLPESSARTQAHREAPRAPNPALR